MDTFQKIYRPEIYNANSAAGKLYQPSLKNQDYSLPQIVYDREERSQLAVKQGKFTEEHFIKPPQIMKKLLPTSTAGSLPKPSWLAQPEKLWSPWKLEDQELAEGKQDALRLALQEQQHAGIDIVSDGEQTRQHFVTTFIEHLSGVDFEKRETVRIRDRYDASTPSSCASKPSNPSNGRCLAP
ncbi:hypothetical protein G6F31_018326 [Rhizopus arrhizus]|nr:hypothetical protein G6F31_018326 [Rhizopus arrhizus]